MKKKVLIKSIAAMLLGLLIAPSAILPLGNGWGGDHPDPEMAAIEYNINI